MEYRQRFSPFLVVENARRRRIQDESIVRSFEVEYNRTKGKRRAEAAGELGKAQEILRISQARMKRQTERFESWMGRLPEPDRIMAQELAKANPRAEEISRMATPENTHLLRGLAEHLKYGGTNIELRNAAATHLGRAAAEGSAIAGNELARMARYLVEHEIKYYQESPIAGAVRTALSEGRPNNPWLHVLQAPREVKEFVMKLHQPESGYYHEPTNEVAEHIVSNPVLHRWVLPKIVELLRIKESPGEFYHEIKIANTLGKMAKLGSQVAIVALAEQAQKMHDEKLNSSAEHMLAVGRNLTAYSQNPDHHVLAGPLIAAAMSGKKGEYLGKDSLNSFALDALKRLQPEGWAALRQLSTDQQLPVAMRNSFRLAIKLSRMGGQRPEFSQR